MIEITVYELLGWLGLCIIISAFFMDLIHNKKQYNKVLNTDKLIYDLSKTTGDIQEVLALRQRAIKIVKNKVY